MTALPNSYDHWRLDNGELANLSAKQLSRDLDRMKRLNDAFASRSDKWSHRGVVVFAYDNTDDRTPWQFYVGDHPTSCATLADAVSDASESLRQAAEMLGEIDGEIK